MSTYHPQENAGALRSALSRKVTPAQVTKALNTVRKLNKGGATKVAQYRALEEMGYTVADIARICATAWGKSVYYQLVRNQLAQKATGQPTKADLLAEANAKIAELEQALRTLKAAAKAANK